MGQILEMAANRSGSLIPLSTPSITGNELDYVSKAVTSEWVSTAGPYVEDFSRSFTEWLGEEVHCIPCASGTAALHLALIGVGVQSGDEVLVSTLSFIAPANAIAYCGAQPVFIDSEDISANINPELVVELVEQRIAAGKKPAAILVVHIYGHPANIAPILEVAKRYDIPVVEDAAESLGATYGDKPVGTLGRVGTFSFNGNKMITCGGGGMAVTGDPKIADHMRRLSTQSKLPGPSYQHDQIGFNYRMTNLAAALGLGQLEKLDEFVSARRKIAERYQEAFSKVSGISFLSEPSWGRSAYWLSVITVDAAKFGTNRDQLLSHLKKSEIETRPLWTPLHKQPVFIGSDYLGEDSSTRYQKHGLCLPSSAHLTQEEQSTVIDCILSAQSTARSS